jgi:hypothetical protein
MAPDVACQEKFTVSPLGSLATQVTVHLSLGVSVSGLMVRESGLAVRLKTFGGLFPPSCVVSPPPQPTVPTKIKVRQINAISLLKYT